MLEFETKGFMLKRRINRKMERKAKRKMKRKMNRKMNRKMRIAKIAKTWMTGKHPHR